MKKVKWDESVRMSRWGRESNFCGGGKDIKENF